MPLPDEERRREYPGDRFSQRVINQDLDKLVDRLQDEDFGDGHLEQGHNQIELYRHDGTTVSLFVMDEGAELPEHTVVDGSVMIQVLEGEVGIGTGDSEDSLSTEENSVVTLGPGVKHKVRAQSPSRLIVTIMR